jgi:hypothetical protein
MGYEDINDAHGYRHTVMQLCNRGPVLRRPAKCWNGFVWTPHVLSYSKVARRQAKHILVLKNMNLFYSLSTHMSSENQQDMKPIS